MKRAYVVLLAGLLGCGAEAVDVEAEYEVMPEGKADNFRSADGREYIVSATAQVELESADGTPEARMEKARELVSAKLLQIGWFLNLYLADKQEDDSNRGYGGFNAMARNSSVEALRIDALSDTTFSFNFEATMAAPSNLLTNSAEGVLPTRDTPDGKMFDLKMGKLDNATLLSGSWQGSYDVHSWDPAKQSAADVEALPVIIKPLERSKNAYLNYEALYADGKLVVGAQFGHDYNASRSDLRESRQLYNDLIDIGFKSPVRRYEDLKLTSGPLTRKSTFRGQAVDVEVKIVHPGMVGDPADNAKELRTALLDLLATREVVLFNGHAGTSGRLLPADFKNSTDGNILATEYPTLKLYDGFQLFLIEGCQTYARFTDGFRQNPARRGPNGELVNMNIVTSTSYTWTKNGADSMELILFPLVGTRASTNIKPSTWDDVLRGFSKQHNTAFMGVNGIDSDPHAHPYARFDKLGATCRSASTCGGEGNLCVKPKTVNNKVCASICIDDAGCPADYRCAKMVTGGDVAPSACLKR